MFLHKVFMLMLYRNLIPMLLFACKKYRLTTLHDL
jgi:hypothetical protein